MTSPNAVSIRQDRGIVAMHDSFLSPLSPAPTAATLSLIGYIPAARCGMDHETCLVGAQGVVAPQGIDTRLPKGVNAPQSVFGKGCPRPPLLTLYMPGTTTLNPLVIQAPVLTYALPGSESHRQLRPNPDAT